MKPTTDKLIRQLFKKRGYVSAVYLQDPEKKTKGRPSLVYLEKWYMGQNTREAVLKALGAQ